jgi:hypothetical protein
VTRRLPGQPFPGSDQPIARKEELSGERIDPLLALVPTGCYSNVSRVFILKDVVTEFVGGREPAPARRAVRPDDSDTETRLQQERGPCLHAVGDDHLQPRSSADGGHRSERLQSTSQTAAQFQRHSPRRVRLPGWTELLQPCRLHRRRGQEAVQ